MSITMIELVSGTCRWPLGDPKDGELRFCGKTSDLSLSYCDKHMAEAHAPQRKKMTAP